MVPPNKDEEYTKAVTAVFRLFKFRPRSEHEIVQRLKTKKFSKGTIEQAVQYFRRLKLIDDERFARDWTNSRLNRPFGFHRIRSELKQKGIPPDILRQAISAAQEEYDELGVVLGLARRRWARYEGLDEAKARQRLYQYLNRKGFNQGTILKALRQLKSTE